MIVMVSVGSGAQAQVEEIISSMGADLIYVFPGTTTSARTRLGTGSLPTLTEDDAKAIKREIAEVDVVAPYLWGHGQIIKGNANWFTTVLGITPEYSRPAGRGLEDGKPFAAKDFHRNNKLVLLGNTVAQKLLAGRDPSGLVVGVNEFRSRWSVCCRPRILMGGWDQDDLVLIPMGPARKKVLGESRLADAWSAA